ncbi:hypothetical protein G7Y89_g4952 [Cudoniella acicularis]|uniref:Heterokaryon incompatibility domain-containing protein n=1 Tax=Cudoniella acicularis TaxID=354080 RepID=A0A8H4RP81_9HELO|nr:hypothetical protein G7Y89_g4952 [Cudoniella acicularis]
MPSKRTKFPSSSKTTVYSAIDGEVFTIWTTHPREDFEESKLIAQLGQERAQWKARLTRKKDKGMGDEEEEGHERNLEDYIGERVEGLWENVRSEDAERILRLEDALTNKEDEVLRLQEVIRFSDVTATQLRERIKTLEARMSARLLNMLIPGVIYAPLDVASKDIRLLRLLDRQTPGLPSCEIFNASLSNDITYEALSYPWGDPKLRGSILLNGIITSVTENLARALEDIRLDQDIRVLWADALCINQDDTTERNHQVKQMGTIYQKAERVVVWLGRPKISGEVAKPSVLDSLQTHFNLGLKYSAFQPTLKAQWLELTALCELPYWRRLWIVQEIGLASDLHVYHGRSYQDWKLFSKIRENVERTKNQPDLHQSLQGIAKTITESVPGRLDQQREFRQPLWLKELHAAARHLFSKSQTVAKAAKILSEISKFSRASETTPSERHRKGRPLHLSRTGPALTQHSTSHILKQGTLGFEFITILAEWDPKWILKQDSFPFSRVLRFIADEDLESTQYTNPKNNIEIPCLLPLNPDFAETYHLLPRNLEYVREHERQGYHAELKKICNKLVKLLWYSGFGHLPHLASQFKEDQMVFLPWRKKLEVSGHKLKLRREELKRMDRTPSSGLEEAIKQGDEEDVLGRQREDDRRKEDDVRREELKTIEREHLHIKLMERGLNQLYSKHQEVAEYLDACQKFNTNVQNFVKQLESDAESHQPAFLLCTLLETCERSLCHDSRDKVYGLLGLASDVKDEDLLVDYSKSMFELFWDVARLAQKQGEAREGGREEHVDIVVSHKAGLIRFGQMLQRSLGGPFLIDGMFQQRVGYTEHSFPAPFSLVGFATGTVLLLDSGNGLSPSLVKTLKQYFRRETGWGTSDDMVEAALKQLQDTNHDLIHPFTTGYSYGSTQPGVQNCFQIPNIRAAKAKSVRKQPVLFVEDSGLIGLAPYNTRDDDLLVQFSNCDVAAIVRPSVEDETKFLLIGRAVVARRFGETRKTVSESSAELFRYNVPEPSRLLASEGILFWIDPVTLQELTCPVGEEREYSFDTLLV